MGFGGLLFGIGMVIVVFIAICIYPFLIWQRYDRRKSVFSLEFICRILLRASWWGMILGGKLGIGWIIGVSIGIAVFILLTYGIYVALVDVHYEFSVTY